MKIYIDGACAVHTGKNGAWAYVVVVDDYAIHEDSGFESETTNHRMEMMAFIKALGQFIDYPDKIEVVTDLNMLVNAKAYLARWKTNKWRTSKNTDVLHQDLWQDIDYLLDQLDVDIQWVKGHSGEKWNEYVDGLCKLVAEQTPVGELKLAENCYTTNG